MGDGSLQRQLFGSEQPSNRFELFLSLCTSRARMFENNTFNYFDKFSLFPTAFAKMADSKQYAHLISKYPNRMGVGLAVDVRGPQKVIFKNHVESFWDPRPKGVSHLVWSVSGIYIYIAIRIAFKVAQSVF